MPIAARRTERPQGACENHRPKAGSERLEGFTRRAVCCRCRCTLIRTEAMKRWIRSGYLG